MNKLDVMDHAIIDILSSDARTSNKEIARTLQITETTVAARIRSLLDRKAIRIAARQSALGKSGHRILALLDFYLEDSSKMHAVSHALAGVPNVLAVYETARRPELVAYARAQDMQGFSDLIATLHATVPNLAQLDTMPIIDMRRSHKLIGNLQPPPLPRPPAKDLGERLVQALESDGRQSIRALGRQLGLSDTAVRYRLNKLMKETGLEIVAVRDAKSMGYQIWTDVRLTVAPSRLKGIQENFIRHENVITAAHMSGSHNLQLVLISRNVEDIDIFVHDHIRNLSGIVDFTIRRIPRVVKYNYNVIM